VTRRIALAVLLLAGAVACNDSSSAPPAMAPPVAVVKVTTRDVLERIEATGQLSARDQATVAAEVSGRVTEVVIEEGSAAERGAVILRIDPERRELELASARARGAEVRAGLSQQRRDTGRVRKLFKQNVAAQARLDQAEMELLLAGSRVDAANAQLGVAERALADSNVTAPFSGLIADRFVSPGEFVQVGTPLFELVALDPIEVEFRLAERDSSRVALGQAVDVRVAPYPEEVFRASVSMISPIIDERTRTLKVKARIDNSDGRLRPGLFARADLGVEERADVRMIPEEAVLQRSDGPVVFVIGEEDRVERRVIATGMIEGGRVEVVEGLAPGDQVVIRGHASLIDGAVVSLRNTDGTAAGPDVASQP
jgi:RND family efflux transporter MFP subunit